MAFDYKKEYKEFYLPPRTPGIVTVPAMNFLAVRGQGDPNEEHGAYKQALEQLYAVAYTIKMSKRNPPEGYFDYVDLAHPSAGVCDQGGLRPGRPGSDGKETAGLLPGGVLPLGGGSVRPVYAHRPL